MRIIKIDADDPESYQEAIVAALQVLKRGGVVMYPTETCYGLGVDVFNLNALNRLYKLKKMPNSKPVSIVVDSLAEAEKYADFGENGPARKYALKFWPGPLTLVLPRKEILPVFLNEGIDSVGIRCTNCGLCLDLVNAFGGPLTTTSANLSQWPEVYDVESYLKQLIDEPLRPDLILDAGILPKNKPSTIIKFENGELKLIREGLLWAQISKM